MSMNTRHLSTAVIATFFLCFLPISGNSQAEKGNDLTSIKKRIEEFQKNTMMLNSINFITLIRDIKAIPDNPIHPNWNELKFEKAKSLVVVLSILHTRIDWDFDLTKKPHAHIAPPPATGLPSGVAPEAIKDSVLRHEYEVQLAANKEHAKLFNEQSALRNEYKNGGDFFRRYIQHYFSSSDRSRILIFLEKDEKIKDKAEILKLLD